MRVGFPVFVIALLVLSGCDLTGETSQSQSPNFEVTNDLETRITDLSGGTRSTAARVTATAESDFSVSGVARVEPPEVKGTQTKASHLSFNDAGDDRVFVGYKIRGNPYGGGIDILDADEPRNLKSTNSLQTDNLDVQEVIDDPDAGAEYVAGALKTKRAGVSPAALTKLSFEDSDNNISVTHKRLSGNVAKSVVNAPSGDSRHDLYVVTDGNALYRYDSSLGDELKQTVSGVEFSSITAHQDLLIMLTKSGALWKSDFSSANEPWKSDLTLEESEIRPLGIARLTTSNHENSSDDFVYAALNTGGFRVLNDDASEKLFSRTEGDYTSVSATDGSDYLYASRTDGTVEVYEFDGNNSPSWSSDPIATINTADYQNGSSDVQSNQVLAVDDYLYVANGSEGTLVLEVNDGS